MFKSENMITGKWAGLDINKMNTTHLVRAIDKLSRNIQKTYQYPNPEVDKEGTKEGSWEYKLNELKQELKLRDQIIKCNRNKYYYTCKGTIRKRAAK